MENNAFNKEVFKMKIFGLANTKIYLQALILILLVIRCDGEAVSCPDVTVSHATRSTDEVTYNTIVTYTCDTGHEKTEGDLSRTCQANQTWSGTKPVCSAVRCPDVTVSHATRSTDEVTYNTIVTYTCDTGHEKTEGDLSRTCQANQTWSGTKPVCSAKKCSAVDIANSSWKPFQAEYDYSTSVIYTCEKGFSHTGGDLIRTCQADKMWNGTAPSCQKIKLGETSCVIEGHVNSCEDTNAECRGSDNRCICKAEYYDDNGNNTAGGTCKMKVGLGINCSTAVSDSCHDSHAYCEISSTRCKCTSNYYDDNHKTVHGGSCQPRIGIDENCQTSVSVTDDQCIDLKARCSSTNSKCTCIIGYHPEDSGTTKTCQANKPLGGGCNPSNRGECSDSNAGCQTNGTGYVCTCKVGYFDDNGFDHEGHCRSMDILMVSGIKFSNIESRSFTVYWTEPAETTHVSSYTVSWTPGEGNSSDLTSPTEDIQKLMAGAKYTVTVTTVNYMTQVSVPRTVSASKEQSTRPYKPGSIKTADSELNASDTTITLVWTAAVGYVSKYRVQVFDEEVEKGATTVNTTTATISFSDMKNGHRYTVNITAESMPYDGGKTVDGDTYNGQIKTVVMPPSAPQNFNCREQKDTYIVLTWEDPQYPNGDLSYFQIEVYTYTTSIKTVQTDNLVYERKVSGLEPGTYYKFWIYTQNEKFISKEHTETNCKTLDKVSEAPNNLTVYNVTSRSLFVFWKKPTNPYGEILGYVLQLYNDSGVCIKEFITNCTDCLGTLNSAHLASGCSESTTVPLSKTEISAEDQDPQEITGLLPYSNYSVTVEAVNEKGKGHKAEAAIATLEEEPVKPDNVNVKNKTATSFIVTWSKGPVRPGMTSYVIKTTAQEPAENKEETVTGYDTEMYLVEGLEEYWNYSVQVTAFTSVGKASSSVKENIRTLPIAPGPVADFRIITGDDAAEGGTYQTLIVQWKIPKILERNSEITGYKFRYNDTTENITTRLLTAKGDGSEEFIYKQTINVVPETIYTIQVLAVNHMEQDGQILTQSKQAPAGVPENEIEKNGEKVIKAEKVSSAQNQLTVPIDLRFFEQLKNGGRVEDGLVVYAEDKNNYSDTQSTTLGLKDFRYMENYAKAAENGFTPYRPVESVFALHLARVRRDTEEAEQFHFQLGDEDCSAVPEGGFCNGPLAADTGYQIRLVVCTNGGCLVSQEYGPFYTQPIPPEESSIGGIVGGAVGGVIAAGIVLAAIGVFLYIRRRRKKGDGCSPIDPTPLHPDIVRKRPVRLDMFAEHLARLHKDSNLLFTAEYDDLKTLSPSHSTTAADDEENRLKNRYINILPFDQTRVKLLQKTDDDSDFINANYLPGYKSPREYIGCQGPIPATVDDFWKMVWEQNVAVIVILTLCKEGNKVKCEQYWPDEVADPKQYGDIVVEVKTLSNIKTYDYRIMRLTYANCTKTVKHFHFLSWLDFQANITHDTILDFITQVRSHVQPPDTAGPTIVHCSAGVGRTGTYICLDHLMQFIQDHDFSTEVDIFDMVLKLRENRPHMVQTEQQYVFIHDCLNEMLERKIQAMREADNIYVNQGFNQEEDLYQNTAMSDNPYQNVTISGGQPLQNTEL